MRARAAPAWPRRVVTWLLNDADAPLDRCLAGGAYAAREILKVVGCTVPKVVPTFRY